MASVPFLSRLNPLEYLALTFSFLLILLETLIRSITLLLPSPVIRFFYHLSRNTFNSLSSPYSRRARRRKKNVTSPLAQAHDFVELCELQGYVAEEHVVQTGDGYLLGLHRLAYRREGEEGGRVNDGSDGCMRKKVVYLHHGLLMNSEVWVCLTERERCLPFMLVEQGYDVWLGNNRGNKYSKKSLHAKPTETRFWDFSMDQFAFHDIPDSINYILTTTHQPNLSYIGFSQGTAQAFATLSIHPTLNSKVNCFIALAPAMAPPGLASGIVASLCKSNPEILFLAFGRRAILGSATMWQALLYPALFTWFIDKSLDFLFSWKTRNISLHQKLAAYPHLYSFTSTKCVVHWFQIIRNSTFQMFDDETSTPLASITGGNAGKYYKVAKFPTRNIKTPIVLVYGGSDSLVDIKLMLKELPGHTVAKGIGKYEHLDLLWASDVEKLVFPHVLEALDSYAQPSSTKQDALGWSTGAQRRIADGSSSDVPSSQQRHMYGQGRSTGSLGPPGYSDSAAARRHSLREAVARGQQAAWELDRFESGEGDLHRTSTWGDGEGEQLDESDVETYDGREGEEEGTGSGPERYALTPVPMSKQLPRNIANGQHGEVRPPTPPQKSSGRALGSPMGEGRRGFPSPTSPPPSASQTTTMITGSPKLPDVTSPRHSVLSDTTATTVRPAAHRSGPEGWWSSTSTSTASAVEDGEGDEGNGGSGGTSGTALPALPA